MLSDYFDHYVQSYKPYKGGAWCYEDGCIYRALELMHEATGEQRWLDHLLRMVNAQLLAGPALAGYEPNDYNIDNILPGRALLYLHKVTRKAVYLEASTLLIEQLATHPRTRSGVYWHKLRYPWQVWLDGLYMGAPFQIAYGIRQHQEELVQDALTQVSTALNMTHVPETGLFAHAVDESCKQAWADVRTGHSSAHWARALGWLAMALVDIAELVSTEEFAPLRERTEELLSRVSELRKNGGLWLQVIDQPELEGNYQESSASAMLSYALLKGGKLGLCANPGKELSTTLFKSVLGMTPEGRLQMIDICEVAGLGMFEDRYRDGSAEYYLSESRVADDAKGVGPLMMSYAMTL